MPPLANIFLPIAHPNYLIPSCYCSNSKYLTYDVVSFGSTKNHILENLKMLQTIIQSNNYLENLNQEKYQGKNLKPLFMDSFQLTQGFRDISLRRRTFSNL